MADLPRVRRLRVPSVLRGLDLHVGGRGLPRYLPLQTLPTRLAMRKPWDRHRHGCQCAWHKAQEPHRRKHPKWSFVFVTDPRTGRSVRCCPRWWARTLGRRKSLATLRTQGRQNVFTSETGATAALKRWRHTKRMPLTGKRFVALATKGRLARRLQRRRDKRVAE